MHYSDEDMMANYNKGFQDGLEAARQEWFDFVKDMETNPYEEN